MSICTVKSSLTKSPALQDILNVSFIPSAFVKSNLFHFRSITPKSYNPEVLFLNYLQMLYSLEPVLRRYIFTHDVVYEYVHSTRVREYEC